LDANGIPQVDYPGNPNQEPVSAISVASCQTTDIGCELALAFQNGDPSKPLILGKIQNPPAESETPSADQAELFLPQADQDPLQATIDSERIVFQADKEIVLKCGKSSITLTRAGKVLIRGAFLLSRSSGVNRIKGGSVQIN
jgi:hypothetical protein